MPTTYRCTVKTNHIRMRGMILPGFSREFRRDSRAALAECTAAFVEILRRNIPDVGAEAWLERSGRLGPIVLARYSGRRTRTDGVTGAALAGRWMLEEGESDGLPDMIDVGTQRPTDPR